MSTIKLRRSAVSGNKPNTSQLDLGEVAINTHDGKMFFKRDKNGELSIIELGGAAVAENVFYVSKSGNDSNAGTSIDRAFLTLDKALTVAAERRGTAGLDSDGAEGSVLENKTRRDLGLYIDAAKYDVALGTKFNQVFQGRAGSYTKGITEVLFSIDATKDLVNDLSAISGDALSRSDAYFDEVKDIIQNGRNNADALAAAQYPTPTNASTYYDSSQTEDDASRSKVKLLNNKVFISEEVNEFVKATYDISYDSAKCKRDIRFAVEALAYDATYLGNAGAYDNANFFFHNGAQIPAYQKTETAAAYDRMAVVLEGVLKDSAVVLSGSGGNYTTTQNTTGLSPRQLKIDELSASTTMIGNVIKNGVSSLPASRITPDLDSRVTFSSAGLDTAALKTSFDAIATNKTTIINNVIDLVDSEYPLLFGIGDRYVDVLDAPEIASTIYLKTGDYTINNPVEVPKNVSIIGDNLKNTSIRPKNKTSDMFYVNNNGYISDITFRDHLQPAAVIAWNPAGDSASNIIVNSPYIRNCTSITGPDLSRNDDGTYVYPDAVDAAKPAQGGDGIRNDGSKVGGIRSIVVDSFTQINQGGKGVYLLNRGYCQLVSVFTVYCDVGFLAENGGFASITNSNSSFGNIGLKATGVTPKLYEASVDNNQDQIDNIITLKNLTKRPNISDAIKFSSDPLYYTVDSASYDSDTGLGSIKLQESPDINLSDNDSATFHQRSALSSSGHTFEWIGTGTDVRTAFPYRGGVPNQTDEVVQDSDRAGLCFVTSTDQKGDFRVGEDFLIQRSTGTIEGQAFDRSLFARVTPFSLALED
tara:strand:- start:549 stop:2990 length:2442 start_codon:yes stop_codon:yes gene_type:complete